MLSKFYNNGGKYLFFFLIFNIIFLILMTAIKLGLPFVLSIFISIWLYPLSNFIHKKTKIPKGIINLLCIIVSITILTLSVFLVGSGIFEETTEVITDLSELNIDTAWVNRQIDLAKNLMDDISPEIFTTLTNTLENMLANLGSYLAIVLNYILKIASAVPSIIIGIIITILSSYFIMSDYEMIQKNLLEIDFGKNNDLIRKIFCKIYSLIINYIQSYGLLLTITFVECIAIFSLTKSNYTFTLSIVCVVLDILPIIGTAVIFIPMAFCYIIIGSYLYAAILIISYVLMIVIRNIMQPKLLSKTMEIHPVLILISLYVGLKIGGLAGIIYLILLIAFVKLLYECGLIEIKKRKLTVGS